MSLPSGAAVQVGQRHIFQYWTRDIAPSGAAARNLSAAVGVTFQ